MHHTDGDQPTAHALPSHVAETVKKIGILWRLALYDKFVEVWLNTGMHEE